MAESIAVKGCLVRCGLFEGHQGIWWDWTVCRAEEGLCLEMRLEGKAGVRL